MFGKDKKINYTVVVLAVLLAVAVIYIAVIQFNSYQNNRLVQAYQQGFVQSQEQTLIAVINEVASKGYVQITDFSSNQSVVLVPYQPPAEQQDE